MEKPFRQSNVELLRIIAMLMIVGVHFASYSSISTTFEISLNYIWLTMLSHGVKIGVALFTLISAYFLSESMFKWKKLAKLYFDVFFYSVGIFAICRIIFGGGYKDLIRAIFPVTFSSYWYVTAYIWLYLLSPFINKMLNTLDKKKHQLLIVLLLAIWFQKLLFSTKVDAVNCLTWLITIYVIGSYLSKYGMNIRKPFLLTAIAYVSYILFAIACSYFSIAKYYLAISDMLMLTISVLIFIGFARFDIKSSKVINILASCSFSVYLITEHLMFRNVLWQNIFHGSGAYNASFFIPYNLMALIVIYMVCSVIDMIKKTTIDNCFINYWKIDNKEIRHIDNYCLCLDEDIFNGIRIK